MMLEVLAMPQIRCWRVRQSQEGSVYGVSIPSAVFQVTSAHKPVEVLPQARSKQAAQTLGSMRYDNTTLKLSSPELPAQTPHLWSASLTQLTDRFPLITAARTAKTGLAIGLAFGLAQDLLSTLKGRPPGYLSFIKPAGKPRRKESVEQ